MKIVFHRGCPYCMDIAVRRKPRKGWMKIFPGSKFFQCKSCEHKYLEIYSCSIGFSKKTLSKEKYLDGKK